MAETHDSGVVLFCGVVPRELLRRFRVALGDEGGSEAYGGAIARHMLLDEQQRHDEFGRYVAWLGELPRQSDADFRAFLPLSLVEGWNQHTAGTQILKIRLGSALFGALEGERLQGRAGEVLSVGHSLSRWLDCWQHGKAAEIATFAGILASIYAEAGEQPPSFNPAAPAPTEPGTAVLIRRSRHALQHRDGYRIEFVDGPLVVGGLRVAAVCDHAGRKIVVDRSTSAEDMTQGLREAMDMADKRQRRANGGAL